MQQKVLDRFRFFVNWLSSGAPSDEVLVWLSVCSELQIVCIRSSWCHWPLKTPSSLASFTSRLVLPFWYQPTALSRRSGYAEHRHCQTHLYLSNDLFSADQSSQQMAQILSAFVRRWLDIQQQQQQPFNGRLSGTTLVGRYQKKHSSAHTHPGQQTSFLG